MAFDMANISLGWLAVMVIFLVIEAMVPGLVSIWFAGGALVAFVLGLAGTPLWVQIVVFLVVSFLLVVSLRPLSRKYFNRDRTRTNAQSVIGKHAVVKERIDNLAAQGLVTVDGMDWTARAAEEGQIIETGETVEILRIEGVKLIVGTQGEEMV